MDFMDHITELLKQFRSEQMLKWKQMLAIEVLAAVLAETLMNNGVSIDCENESITWPFGQVTHPPSTTGKSTKGKAKNKSVKSGKSGTIFRVLVNEIQLKSEPNINKQADCIPSSSTCASDVDRTDQVTVRGGVGSSLPSTMDATNNGNSSSDGESEAPKGHTGFPARVVKS